MTMHHVLAILLVFRLGVLDAGMALANGWAHGSIPFAALLVGLTVEDSTTRARSAQYLGLRGSVLAVRPLIDLLGGGEENPQVRSAAYTALGRLNDTAGIVVLEGCLKQETRAELRADCVLALGELGRHGTLVTILATLGGDKNILVRSRAIEALGMFDSREAVETLSTVVTEGQNPSLRFRAIRSLGRSASPNALDALLFALGHPLSDKELLLTISSLSRVPAPEAVAPLRKLLDTTDNPRLRAQITVTLGAIHDGDTMATLVGLLADDVPAVRYFAVDGLRALGDPAAAASLRDFSLGLLQGLAERLRRQNEADAGALVLDLRLLIIAMRALEALDPVIAEPVFSGAARLPEITLDSTIAVKIADSLYECRRLAVYGLGYTGSPDAEAILLGPEGRGHSDPRIRATAARSLAVLGRPAGAAALVGMLADDSAEVRWTAALGLGRLGAAEAVPALVERLSDAAAGVREEASLSLAYIGDGRAREALAQVAGTDESAQVRAAANFALDLLGEDGAAQ